MSAATTPEATLARIPGWESASIRELSGGLTNRTFLLESGGRRAVLKIDAERRAAPYNPRDEEATLQRTAARAGLANHVLHADETTYLTEYLEGHVWIRADLESDDNLRRLATALRRMHSLPLTGRSFDALSAAQGYRVLIRDRDPRLARLHVATVESMRRPHQLCFCHNDLVAGNIIDADGLKFLDWEYACDNDPLFDIATVVAHHGLSNRQAHFLLDAYFDGDGARWRRQLARQERLYDALHWLWRAARRRGRAAGGIA